MTRNKKLTEEYKALLDFTIDLLARHDPLGFVDIGAPHDEYSLEARLLIARLDKVSSSTKLSETMRKVFAEVIDPLTAGPASRYREASEELWQKLNKDRNQEHQS